MKLLIVLTLFGFSLAELTSYSEFKSANTKSVSEYASELGFKTFDIEFLKFKIENQRNYGSEEEEERKFNFLKSLDFIGKHNEKYKRGEVTHFVGITPNADLSREEYLSRFTMPKPLNVTRVNFNEIVPLPNLPASFDWRAQGKVTPVKNQGGCGSCWAFSTAATVESGYLIHHNQRVTLSEQQMVDCMNTNCGGRYINDALHYVQQNGLEQDSNYPYVSGNGRAGSCRNDAGKWHAHISGYQMMCRAAGQNPCSDEQIMSAVQAHGPIAFMLDAQGDDFGHYRGGVLTTGVCEWKAVHALAIVGWGTENNIPYWIIKNSWGSGWGDGGFLKMARGHNLRGINEYIYYPTF